MKNKIITKTVSLMLIMVILLGTFIVPASAISAKRKENPYLIFSKWHICRLVDYSEANCEDDGFLKYKCLFCKYTKTVVKESYGHSMIETETVTPTCTEDGYILYNCKNCNHVDKETISKTGHSFFESQSIAPTCTEDGYVERKCENCELTETEIISSSGHMLVEEEKVEATCEEDGYTKYVCENCDFSETVTNHKTGHSIIFVDGDDATCEEEGWGYYECENCDYNYHIDIQPKGHNIVYVPAIKPTCTEEGRTEGKYCSDCNKVFKRSRVLSSKHSYETVVIKSTLEQDGYIRSECTVCGDVKEEVIAKPLKLVFSEDVIYYYTGYEVKPEVVVYDANNNLIDSKEYTIQYEDNVEQGKGRAIAIFTGEKYDGELEGEFLINYNVGIRVSKVRGKGFSVKFTITPAVQKYQIQYYDSPSKAKTITKNVKVDCRETVTYTAKGLNVSPYTVRVRVMIDGRWSNWGAKMINIQSY